MCPNFAECMRKVVLRSSTLFNGEVDHDNFIKGKGKGGPKRPPDGVHFDAGKHKWVAVLDVALWAWFPGRGSLGVALWVWFSGRGSLGAVLGAVPSERGPLNVAL